MGSLSTVHLLNKFPVHMEREIESLRSFPIMSYCRLLCGSSLAAVPGPAWAFDEPLQRTIKSRLLCSIPGLEIYI